MNVRLSQFLLLPVIFAAGVVGAQSQGLSADSSTPKAPNVIEADAIANVVEKITRAQTTEGHRKLDVFEGQWDISGSLALHGGEPALFIKGESTIEWILDGFFMQESFAGTISLDAEHTTPIFRTDGVGMASFDAVADTYTGVWMDNANPRIVQARGNWSDDGGQLIFAGDTPDPLQPDVMLTFVSTTTVVDEDTCHSVITSERKGKEMFCMEIEYTRRK